MGVWTFSVGERTVTAIPDKLTPEILDLLAGLGAAGADETQ